MYASYPDPEVLAEVEEWKKNLANYSTLVVGKTLVFLNGTSEECRFRECNLGDLICDAMVPLSLLHASQVKEYRRKAYRTAGDLLRT